jgi:Ca2+-binding RTX toxin-like protein
VLLDQGGYADLVLRGGPFAPGATPELEGDSEIEVEFVGDDIYATATGTGRADYFEWGPGLGREAGLNLNPGRAADEDVDVTVEGDLSFLNAVGRGGNDSILSAPGGVFTNAQHVFSTGGRGDDRLEAPRDGGGLLQGGPGDDVLIGGRRGNLLEGGGGNDRMSGAGGDNGITTAHATAMMMSAPPITPWGSTSPPAAPVGSATANSTMPSNPAQTGKASPHHWPVTAPNSERPRRTTTKMAMGSMVVTTRIRL